jgi:hypothetical protein
MSQWFLTDFGEHDVLQQPEVGVPKPAATQPVPAAAAVSHGPAAEPSQALVSVQEQAIVATASTGAYAPVPVQEPANLATASVAAANAPGPAVHGVIRQVRGTKE